MTRTLYAIGRKKATYNVQFKLFQNGRLRKPPYLNSLELRKDWPTMALWYGGEVKRYLRLIRLAENKRKAAQLLQQAIIHAKAAWHYAGRSCKEDKE